MSDSPSSADPQALLAHAASVRSLARNLVLDPTRAEDVEQEAWLEALERPPAHARNLSGWLGSVVKNAARQLGRGETRRKRREGSVAARDEAPSTEELVEQTEMQHEVVATVLELEEPYRTAILMRYWREHSPQEIARMQGVPGSTVRSRLRRAHEELRARLDRKFRGDRQAWSLVLATSVRTAERAKVAGASSAPALFTGAVVMGWKLKLVLVVVLAAIAAWQVWPEVALSPGELGPASTSDTTTPRLERPVQVVVEEDGRGAPARPSESQREAVLAAASLPAIHGTVSAPDESPIANASLTLYPKVEDWRERKPLGVGTSDESGGFRIEQYTTDGGSFVILAEAESFRATSLELAEPGDEVALTLPWLGTLVGRVSDAETGEPIAGAAIVWHRDSPAITDAKGIYRLPKAPTDITLHLYARAAGFAEESAQVTLRGPEEATIDFAMQRGTSFVVEVHDRETGAPVVGADIHVDPRAAAFTRTDESGRCEVRMVEGRKHFMRVNAEGYIPFEWSYQMEEIERALSPRIPLARAAVVEGLVLDEDGVPLPGAKVYVINEAKGFFGPFSQLPEEERKSLDLPGHAGHSQPFKLSTQTDEQGKFRISILPEPSPKRVVASSPNGNSASSEPILVESSQHHPWVELALQRGATVHGRVVFNGEPQARREVRWKPADGSAERSATTDSKGRFEFLHVRPGAIEVYLVSHELSKFGPSPRGELVVEAGKSYEQDLSWEIELTEISGRVVSESGELLSGVQIEASHEYPNGRGRVRLESSTGDDGSYAVEVRATQVYELTASHLFIDRSRSDVLAGSTDVDFVLPDLGLIPLQLVDADTGEPVQVHGEPYAVNWRESGQGEFQRAMSPLIHDGTAQLRLPVGRVDLSVHMFELGYAPAQVRGVEVTDDSSPSPLVVEISRGIVAKLALVEEPGESDASLSGHQWILLEDAQLPMLRGPFASEDGRSNSSFNGVRLWMGDPDLRNQMFRPDDRGKARVSGLAPGHYTLRVFPADIRLEPQTFEISAEASAPIEIRWRRP